MPKIEIQISKSEFEHLEETLKPPSEDCWTRDLDKDSILKEIIKRIVDKYRGR